jgi:hypothetical protein
MDFIEIKRIVTNKSGDKITVPETLKVAEIKTFRPWHKNAKDTFKGEATLVVLYSKNKTTGGDDPDDKNLDTLLVNESYDNLRDRLSGRVIVIGK